MKLRSTEEIKAKLEELWPEAENFKVKQWPSKKVEIEVTKMYDWDDVPKLTFKEIDALAEFFDTMNVETASEVRASGCDTCDYGSEYGIEFYVRDGDPYTQVGQNG